MADGPQQVGPQPLLFGFDSEPALLFIGALLFHRQAEFAQHGDHQAALKDIQRLAAQGQDVYKRQGVETPETYALDAVEVSGDQLNADDTMQTLNKYFADFGSTDAFDTDEIKALREKFAK